MIISTPRVRVNRAPRKYHPPEPKLRLSAFQRVLLGLSVLQCEELNRADDCVDEAIRVEREAVEHGLDYTADIDTLLALTTPVLRRCVAHCKQADRYNEVAGIIRSLRDDTIRDPEERETIKRRAATLLRDLAQLFSMRSKLLAAQSSISFQNIIDRTPQEIREARWLLHIGKDLDRQNIAAVEIGVSRLIRTTEQYRMLHAHWAGQQV